jgi:Lhr-like helicase
MLVIAEQDKNIARLDSRTVLELPNGDYFPFASRPYELLKILVKICI